MSDQKERKYRKIGWITSISVQALLLILFYFLIAWKEPFPPIPSYGIELSFGLDNTGQGETPVSSPESVEEEITAPEESTDEIEESIEETSEATSEEVIDDVAEEAVVEETPVTNTPSPDFVEPVSDEEVKPEMEKSEAQPEVVEKVEETKKEPVKEVNPQAVMPSTSDKSNNSSGPDEEKGAAGKKEGSIDGRALMGEQGVSDEASLQMAGWVWDFKPEPKDKSDEAGKIVFRVQVDEFGDIRQVEKILSTVSPEVEVLYKQSVERLTFSQTNDYSPAPLSTGTITFIIRSK